MLERKVKISKSRYSLVFPNLNFWGLTWPLSAFPLHVPDFIYAVDPEYSALLAYGEITGEKYYTIDGEPFELLKLTFNILCNMADLLLSRSWKSCNGG